MKVQTFGVILTVFCLISLFFTINKPFYHESRMKDGSMGNDWTVKPYLVILLILGFAMIFSVAD